MYKRMILRDLKRKKTMNIILLLFVVLSAMFTASSVNNIVAVEGGLDHYFEEAGMADYYILSHKSNGNDSVEELLKNSKNAKSYRKDDVVYTSEDNFKRSGKKIMEYSGVSMVQSLSNSDFNFFDKNNNVVKNVEPGKMYIAGAIPNRSNLQVGDKFTLSIGEINMEFEFAGVLKDALFGSEMMGNPRMLVSNEDLTKIASDDYVKQYNSGSVYYIKTDDLSALQSETADAENVYLAIDNETVKLTYFINMIIAVIILIVSVGLIIVSFVVLRFTIGFTIAEEFREIGVMKAIGLKNTPIRLLYLAKYFCIAVAGAFIGYFLNIPFGKMLIASVSENMVLENRNSVMLGVFCCMAVVVIILFFSWNCTGKIKKLSPIDAVRSGQTGERFHKKSILHLGKTRMKSTAFLAINDVFSQPKQFSIITAIFTICTVFVMVLSVTANTLGSEKMLKLLGITKSDVYFIDSKRITDVISGAKNVNETKQEISDILAENNMPASVYMEEWYNLSVTANGEKYKINFVWCDDTETTDYAYTEGAAPMYENEIALTEFLAEKMGVKIGDTLIIGIDGEDKEFIVTALFQSIMQTGNVGRFCQKFEIPNKLLTGAVGYQINFDDDPDEKTISERIEKLKDIFDNKKNIYDTRGFINAITGVSDTLKSVRDLVLLISLIVIILIAVLMERSFISKEKAEIALMKAIGIKNGAIMTQHTGRFLISVILAQIIAAGLCVPLLILLIDPIFSTMGATAGIEYKFNVVEQFVIYPLIITAAVVISTFLTAVCTRTIKASDTANIE